MAYSSRAPSDPLVGPLKSALQKAIRRGEVDWAATYAFELGKRDIEQVARRLTVIAPEDVDWRLMATVMDASSEEMRKRPHALGQPSLLDIAAGMASMPKQREASYLSYAFWGGFPAKATFGAVEAAIDDVDYGGLLRLLGKALEEKIIFGDTGIGRLIISRALSPNIVKAALFRLRFGGVGTIECLDTAVLGTLDAVGAEEEIIPAVAWELQPDLAFPWYALDAHTGIGSAALGHTARKHGVPKDVLRALMFQFSGILCGPSMKVGRWRRLGEEMVATGNHYGTPEDGARLWALYEPDVKSFIKWMAEKEGLRMR